MNRSMAGNRMRILRPLAFAAGLALVPALTGCIGVATPSMGAAYTDVKWPMFVTSNELGTKQATGVARNWFGFVATGDVSIERLANQAGIREIHHVDVRTKNIMGVGTLTVTVHGE